MNVQEMVDQLALRLEDPDKKSFTDSLKLSTLNNSQIKLAQLLHNNYLTELQVLETGIVASSGVMSETLGSDNTNMSYDVLRGTEGILNVQDGVTGTYMTEIAIEDAKRLENSLLQGTLQNPIYWIFGNKIYVRPTSIVDIDIYYLKMPTDLRYPFTSDEADSGSSTSKFDGAASEGLSSTNDAYNGSTDPERVVIYNITKASYHIVTDYVGADLEFTVSPVASAAFADSESFYFVTHGFDELNLSGVTTDLNESLHNLIVTLAESDCWAIDGKGPRSAEAMKKAFDEIQVLNERYSEATGIGTKKDIR